MIGHYEKQDTLPEDLFRAIQIKSISPAALFCAIGWKYNNTTNWDSHNALAHTLITHAIEAGLEWFADDFERLPFLSPQEHHYSQIVDRHTVQKGRSTPNQSLLVALEKHWNRKPFMFAWNTAGRKRLAVGSQFQWEALNVTVTSINDEKGYLNAVLMDHSGKRSVVKRRFQITHADLRVAESKSRELLDEILGVAAELKKRSFATKHFSTKAWLARIKRDMLPYQRNAMNEAFRELKD